MAKIDRLGWAAGLAFQSFGVRVGVRTTSRAVLQKVKQRLPPGWAPLRSPIVQQLYSVIDGEGSGKVRRFNIVYAGAARIARTLDAEEALDQLEGDLRLAVAEHARPSVFVHAGVVGWNGSAILLPGRSHCGKSRLVEALVRAGCDYYSDEYAVLDARGRVHAYAAPLKLRGEPDGVSRPAPVVVESRAKRKPLSVALVVLAQYAPDATWRPRRLSPGQAALALLENTVPARRRPRESLRALQAVVCSAGAFRTERGEAGDIVERLLKLAGQATSPRHQMQK